MRNRNNTCILVTAFISGLFCTSAFGQVEDGRFPVPSNLRAGAAEVDITPEENDGVMVSGHRRKVFGVGDSLRAGVLVLDDGEPRAAIVTLVTISAWNEMVKRARRRNEEEIGVPPANVMVAASHNHSGPGFDAESQWGGSLIEKLGTAAKQAASTMKPVSVGYGEDRISFSIDRRKVINGRAVARLNPDGPSDPRVKVLRFDDGKSLTPLAVLRHGLGRATPSVAGE